MNLLEQRYQFYHRQQKVHESINEFAIEISRLAASCLFKSLEQSLVRDRVLFGLKNRKALMRIVQFGGDPTTSDVINLYSEITNKNTKPGKRPTNKRNLNEQQILVEDVEGQQSSDGHSGFDDFRGVSGGIAVRNDPEIDIDNINICDNLKEALPDVNITLFRSNKNKTDVESKAANAAAGVGIVTSEGATTTSLFIELGPFTEESIAPLERKAIDFGEKKIELNAEVKICQICDAQFKHQHKYDYHIQNHRNCPICGKDLLGLYYFKLHMLTHTTEKPVTCPKCSRAFKNDDHLKKHLERTHASFDNVTCPICGKVFRRKWSLKTHIEGQHPETIPNSAGRQYECYVCRRQWKSLQTLRSHLATHFRKKKNVLCPQCGLSFSSEGRFRLHLMRDDHNADGGGIVKPHKCEFCSKRFSRAYNLKMHRHVHTGEKSFQCNLCEKWFRHLGNLHEHKLTHIEEKRHHCQFCDHKCRSKSNLRKHMRVHTGE